MLNEVPLLVNSTNIVVDNEISPLVSPVVRLGNIQTPSVELAANHVGYLLTEVEAGIVLAAASNDSKAASWHALVVKDPSGRVTESNRNISYFHVQRIMKINSVPNISGRLFGFFNLNLRAGYDNCWWLVLLVFLPTVLRFLYFLSMRI